MKTKTNFSTFSLWFDFVVAMTTKEIKARYKHAVLGFLWVVLNPVLQMMVIGFVFQFFVPTNSDNYFLFLFTGLLPWNFFSLSILKATPSIVYERSLIQKAKFPREAIPLSIIFSNLFHFFISLFILLGILNFHSILMQNSPIQIIFVQNLHYFALVPAIILLTLLVVGLSLATSSLNVKYRDIYFILQAIVPMWFYASPIVYKLEMLPNNLANYFYFNPLTSIIELFHWALFSTPPYSITNFFLSCSVSIMLFFIGVKLFFKQSRYFDDWI